MNVHLGQPVPLPVSLDARRAEAAAAYPGTRQAPPEDPAAAAPAASARPADSANIVEASPPPSVQEEVAKAAERAAQMAADGRELHFAKDPDSGRIVVEVRDLAGTVLRVIPPSEALDVMSGAKGL